MEEHGRKSAELPATAAASLYREAGVDIDAGNRAVRMMRDAVRSTFGSQVISDVGGFGGVYIPDGQTDALVASADGVGTKLKLSSLLGTYRLSGHDIVNHCVNDILVCGARPLFFLDYIAAEKIVPEQVAETVKGMAEACREVGCALIGGETAELPGIYRAGEYDLAGFIVGSVGKDRLVLGKEITAGDIVLALPSSGLHTNGYSLARKALGIADARREEALKRLNLFEPELGRTLGEALVEPHRSYLREIAPLLDMPECPIKGMAHITGGGLIDNIPRILPEGCGIELYRENWRVPPIFTLIQRTGEIEDSEMARVFNLGLGILLVVGEQAKGAITAQLPEARQVGRVVKHNTGERVRLVAGGFESD